MGRITKEFGGKAAWVSRNTRAFRTFWWKKRDFHRQPFKLGELESWHGRCLSKNSAKKF
jgi:hypothetical protein